MSHQPDTWSEVQVAGHPCDIYEPPERNPHGFVVMYLHGVHLGKLHDQPEFMAAFRRHGLPVVAPITGRSWWCDRICPDFDPNVSAFEHVRQNMLPFLAEQYGAKPTLVGLLGTSMGGQGALRFAFKHPSMFPTVAAIAPAVDYQQRWDEPDDTLREMYRDREQVRQDTATLHVHPLNWPRNLWFSCDPADTRWFDSSERLNMKLTALGIPHEYITNVTGGGHTFEYYNRMATQAVDFLVERLEREARRVT